MSKESLVVSLFFNEPTKQWRFKDILAAATISRPQAANWLRKLVKESLVRRIKPAGRMPYYVGNCESPVYQGRKRLFALRELERQGFLAHLGGLPKAKTVIVFGSMNRWDWHTDSDIDVFVFGDPEGFDQGVFRRKLHREIETFVFKDRAALRALKPALLRNIAEGYVVKGALDFLEVAHA